MKSCKYNFYVVVQLFGDYLLPAAVHSRQSGIYVHQVECPVPGVQVLGHQMVLEQFTQHLRHARRVSLVDGVGAVSEVLLHLQAVLVLLREV